MTILAEMNWRGLRCPIAHIESIGEETIVRDGCKVHQVKLRGRDVPLQVAHYDVDRILTTPTQLIPAQPDTYLLWCWTAELGISVGKNPVIAWALCVDGRMRPVTAQGVNDGDTDPDRDFYVLMPNKSVQCTNEHAENPFYDTLDEYAASESKKADDRKNGDVE
ncbi:hypothetical protein [Sphingomonas sp. BK069]|uniref:hypothetical protein n=1 Tax=Sphingomonas sp. BK069 TaxID=2586979 RepID=UPI0016209A7F|nr:hypothetical protein [Sphingomonas sp. BK069]MBB3347349.1 hypothetical protein [Sphingomonas sp. BK069]